MTKKEFMSKYNIKMREVTNVDIKEAKTTDQRRSNYVITYHNGVEFYSIKGTLKDIQDGLAYAMQV